MFIRGSLVSIEPLAGVRSSRVRTSVRPPRWVRILFTAAEEPERRNRYQVGCCHSGGTGTQAGAERRNRYQVGCCQRRNRYQVGCCQDAQPRNRYPQPRNRYPRNRYPVPEEPVPGWLLSRRSSALGRAKGPPRPGRTGRRGARRNRYEVGCCRRGTVWLTGGTGRGTGTRFRNNRYGGTGRGTGTQVQEPVQPVPGWLLWLLSPRNRHQVGCCRLAVLIVPTPDPPGLAPPGAREPPPPPCHAEALEIPNTPARHGGCP